MIKPVGKTGGADIKPVEKTGGAEDQTSGEDWQS